MKKIVIAGGTGFLGKCLTDYYSSVNTQLFILTRGKSHVADNVHYVTWDGKTKGAWVDVLENADVLINLNGKSVDCRYTKKNKQEIYATRLDSTNILGKAIQEAQHPPKLWINAASATIYRHSLDKEMAEDNGEIGVGFSVDVCQQWEQTFNSFVTMQTRKVLMRTGIVLGKNEGALKPLRMLAKLGFGGKQGLGNQYISWLHEKDFARSVDFIINNHTMLGVYNLTAPAPVTNINFMRALRSVMGISLALPLPTWLLKFGAILIGTETELILKSRRVIPKRLLEAGFVFQYDRIENALTDLCK